MATINRVGDIIEVVTDLSSTPIEITDWSNFIVNTQTSSEDTVIVNIQFSPSKVFTFGDWKYSPYGNLTLINEVDVSEDTAAEILTDLLENVLTPKTQ